MGLVSKDLEIKTLNDEMLEKGFNILDVIPNVDLPEELSKVMLDFVKTKYLDIKIIPGEIALKDYKWQPEKQSHVVYVEHNKEHPDHKEILQTYHYLLLQ